MDDPEANPGSKRSISCSPETSQQSKCDEKPAGKSVANDGSESPARCPICLATPQNDAKSDSCSHNFCFSCLKEWCKVKAECPLCKMPIHSIFYNIRSDSEYDEYKISMPKPDLKYNMFPMPEYSFNWWQSTFRREYYRRRRETDRAIEATNDVGSVRRRRMYYWNKSKVVHVNTRNRVRECSADFFRENPSQVHRLMPWLRRELTVLYGARNKNLIDHLFKKIIDIIPYIDMNSRAFKIMIREYMLEYTDQFIHEFLSFARSPYNVSQYDQAAHYGMNGDRGSQQSGRSMPSRKHRSRQYRTDGRSRWDNSPDSLPLGASAQSMMLSQTTWSEEPPQTPLLPGVGINRLATGLQSHRVSNPSNDAAYMNSNSIGLRFNMNPSIPYSGLCDPLSHRWIFSRDTHRDVDAPLQLQTMDLYRRGGSSARQYQSMERIRAHIGDFQRSMSNLQRRDTGDMSKQGVPSKNNDMIIIWDSDSEEENIAGTSSGNSGSNTIHYKPVTSQIEKNETQRGNDKRIEIKEETSRHRSSSSDFSLTDSSDSDNDNSSSGIEFVRYIKPPHLRTPDAYIVLSSTDEDIPGPSSKVTAVIKPNISVTHCALLSDSDDRNSRIIQSDVLEKTKEFLQNARHASRTSVNQSNTGTNENIPHFMSPPSPATYALEEPVDQLSIPLRDDSMTSPSLNNADDNPGDQVHGHNSVIPNQRDSTPKKIFEKGKVSINFFSSKRRYSSSDSEIDVDYIEEVSISTNGIPSQGDTWTNEHDKDMQQGKALKSVISIPENPASPREQQNENANHCQIDSNSDRGRRSKENSQREKHRHRKRKHSRQSESNNPIMPVHSRRLKKRKKRRQESRSSSVEFVNETR